MVTDVKMRIKADNKTARAFKQVKSDLGGVSKSVVGLSAKIGALVGVGGFGALIATQFKSVDALAKNAQKLDITTESLAALQHATKLYTSVGAPAMNEALTKATKRLGEFNATGGGAAATWLKKLNLDTGELAQLAPDELFQRYSESIRGLNDRGQQMAAISALMGDESRALIGLVDAGSEAFENAQKAVEKYGTGISSLEASRIEDANDAMENFQEAAKGMGIAIAVQLSPHITKFLNYMLEIEESLESLSRDQLTNRIADVTEQVKALKSETSAGDTFLKMMGVNPASTEDVKAIQALEERLVSLNVQLDKVNAKKSGKSDDGEDETFDDDKDAERLAAQFERLNLSLMNEQERLLFAQEEKEFIIEEAFQNGIIRDIERNEALQLLELEHQNKLSDLLARGMGDRAAFEKLNAKAQTKFVLSEMVALTQGVAQHNKTLFKINKVAAIADTIIKTHEGAQKAYAQYASFPPLAAAMAGIAYAAGIARVGAIKNTSFGGGGGAPAGGGGSLPPSVGGTGIDSIVGTIPLDQSRITKQVSITMTKDANYSSQEIRDLIEQLKEEAGDMNIDIIFD